MMTRMNENQLFQAALGLQSPWLVDRCTFEQSASRLDIHLDFPRGSVFCCPVCGVHCKAYDTDQLTWRHLNFFQHQTFLHARTPRVKCSPRGRFLGQTRQRFYTAVRGTGADAGEVDAGAGDRPPVGEHDTAIWRIVHQYVDSARARADHSAVTQVGIDETASRRGQKYVSLFVDLEQRKVLFATPGKDASTVAAFADDLTAHGGDPAAITEVSADMSQAFFNGVTANLPEAAVTFDKFHVVSVVNNAVEQVRRLEGKSHPELSGTRYVWLKNPENLTEKQQNQLDAFDLVGCHLKTARAYQIRWIDKYERVLSLDNTNTSIATPVAIALDTEEQFVMHADKWDKETAHLSSTAQIMGHPNFQAILLMGDKVIPFMLRDLEKNRRMWFSALTYLTGENPVSAKDSGKMDKMIRAWTAWGKQRGLI
jgi:hypothetical protein